MYIDWEPNLHFDPHSPEPFATHGIPIPVYGNYGGPDYTAGVLEGTTPETPDPAPVDALDALFYQHDLVYQHFRDGVITNPALLVAADVHLVESMYALTYTDPGDPNYDPEAGLYEGFSTLGLVGQLAAEGALQQLPPADQLIIAAAAQEALVNLEAGLAAIPGEAKSLHGAFHVFEHKFLNALV
jgi:hypothetical protein